MQMQTTSKPIKRITVVVYAVLTGFCIGYLAGEANTAERYSVTTTQKAQQ